MQEERKMAVAGTFYPDSCHRLEKMISTFNRAFDTHTIPPDILAIKPRAIIVPHAGYVYLWFTRCTW